MILLVTDCRYLLRMCCPPLHPPELWRRVFRLYQQLCNCVFAGEALSQQMVDMIHACEAQHDAEPDHCWRILRVAECFKASCQQRGIAPTMEQIMAELIMEAADR